MVAWTCGLLVASKALNGPAWHPMTSTDLWYGATGICAIVAGCGLAAGLYRGRYLRGSRDEVIAVGQAVALTAGCLLATGPVLMGGLPAWPEQIPAAARCWPWRRCSARGTRRSQCGSDRCLRPPPR